jgi:transposase
MLRTMLYGAAQILMTQSRHWSWLKAWGMKLGQRWGMRRTIVAVARRLAAVLHRMRTDGTDFRWGREPGTAVAAA